MFTKSYSAKFISVAILAAGTITGLLASTSASAALVSGNATITIDNAAVAAANPGGWFFETHWGVGYEALQIDGSTAGGTALNTTGSNALLFPVNPNTTTIVTSTTLYGRTLQATTMDASNTSAAGTQIGLNGALRMRPPSLTTSLTPYDLSLVKTGSDWFIRTFDNAFSYANLFKLGNVSESLNGNGELLLSGDLMMTGGWAGLLGANQNAVVGSFNLAPAAVPVPAAVWLFGSGLMGLLGSARRKKAVAA